MGVVLAPGPMLVLVLMLMLMLMLGLGPARAHRIQHRPLGNVAIRFSHPARRPHHLVSS